MKQVTCSGNSLINTFNNSYIITALGYRQQTTLVKIPSILFAVVADSTLADDLSRHGHWVHDSLSWESAQLLLCLGVFIESQRQWQQNYLNCF